MHFKKCIKNLTPPPQRIFLNALKV